MIKYVLTFFLLLIINIYTISYARYVWNKKNKLGAFGAIFLAVLSIMLPSVYWILI